MLGFGALCEHPLADYGFTGPPVNISLPALALTLAAPALAVQAGKNVGLPALPVTLAAPALGVQAGKHVGLPALPVTLAAPALYVGTGIHLSLPPMAMTLAAPALGVQAGKHVSLHHAFDLSVAIGSLGSDPLGAFAIGDGEPVTLSYARPIRLTLAAPALAVQAGKNVNLPPLSLAVAIKTPEIGARRRKLRIHAIAS